MIGFSIEFKRWYITLRGPRGRVYLCTGFAKQLPVFVPHLNVHEFDQSIDDSLSAILASAWLEDEEEFIEELEVKD